MRRFLLLSCLCFAAILPSFAQFRVIGPAPMTPTAARVQIKALLAKVDESNSAATVKRLTDLTSWYRTIIDQELIAAWQAAPRPNLTPVIEALADPAVATGIVDFSWRQQRQVAFTLQFGPMLGRLIARYPDSGKPFLDDMLASTAPGQQPLDLSPEQVNVVCEILINMPDVGAWKRNAMQIILRYYRPQAQKILEVDAHSDDDDRRDRAYHWLNDFAKIDAAASAAAAAKAPPTRAPATATTATTVGAARPSTGSAPPSILSTVQPTYPSVALRLKVQDSVGLQLMIKPDGAPQIVKILKPVGYGLDDKAMEAVSQWRFNPGTKNGKPVAMLANIQVNFKMALKDGNTMWRAGQMIFGAAKNLTPPQVLDGTLPPPGGPPSDESVVLQFTVSPSGVLSEIHAEHGSPAAAELLARTLATWTFQPAKNNKGPVEATGRVRFVRGNGDDEAQNALTPPLR